ncbi:hypothetical protein M422DRAFT_54261 [Sphaerobolus stellatus SS14]|uniref:Uncharacterized protein n=1 Tax=Sphaerobolus stellatus (strain SS14) TaxID=990650 RepID=A0A0C9UJZ3_SPHS4|nr:hypothetical protein M422DRAFT_54261 [Sphaerobolus stellatus SS14]
MILQLPLQSSTIDPANDHVLIIGGLENLLRIAEIPDEDNLLRRFALNEDISHLRRHAANTIVVTWLGTIDLTTYPPKLKSQPLQYVNTLHNARRFFHDSTVILETEAYPDCFDPDTVRVTRLIYKKSRFFLVHLLQLPPTGTSTFTQGELLFEH